jgi:hypothetical protein
LIKIENTHFIYHIYHNHIPLNNKMDISNGTVVYYGANLGAPVKDDILTIVPGLLGMLDKYQPSPSPSNDYSTMMMKIRHGWFNNSSAHSLMDQLIRLLNANGFTELEPGTGFTSVAMPQKTYAFYRFYNCLAGDFYPHPEHILMATHPGSQNLTGFMFSWLI